MPVNPTYPGVYIEELPSTSRTIVGVATSITAFAGRALRGPVDEPVVLNGFGDFERTFGGLWRGSRLGYSVEDFYTNGGSQAIIVRIFQADQAANDAAAAVAKAANDDAGDADSAINAAKTKAATYSGSARTAADAVVSAAQKAKDGGGDAAAVKTAANNAAASAAQDTTQFDFANLTLQAAAPGVWGQSLRAWVDDNVSAEVAGQMGLNPSDVFNLTIKDAATGDTEMHRNVSVKEGPRQVNKVLKDSRLMRWDGNDQDVKNINLAVLQDYAAKKKDSEDHPEDAGKKSAYQAAALLLMDPISQAEAKLKQAQEELQNATDADRAAKQAAYDSAKAALQDTISAAGGNDGALLASSSFLPDQGQAKKKGLYALEKADLFNLLVIPPYKTSSAANQDVDPDLIGKAAEYCEYRRAFLVVDPPSDWTDKAIALTKFADVGSVGTNSANAAMFFPRVLRVDRLDDNRVSTFCPGGGVAGVFARTDAQRGVWKAPAGLEAGIRGIRGLAISLTDAENGELNPKGLNCLRVIPAAGPVVWGARTLQGNDQLASQWKYVPIRRLALFIEESLYRGTQWVVFEPNDAPLWSQIRLSVGAFMRDLFEKGAFQGVTPQQAYFVKCDHDTNPQYDIDRGIVNIVVGFAPLKPAEFVVIKIQQIPGDIQV